MRRISVAVHAASDVEGTWTRRRADDAHRRSSDPEPLTGTSVARRQGAPGAMRRECNTGRTLKPGSCQGAWRHAKLETPGARVDTPGPGVSSSGDVMLADRRTFMTTAIAAAMAPGILRSRDRARYPIAFSTLGCPGWSWKTILQQADTLGYVALELRGVAGEMDLTKVPELTGTRWAETRKDLAAIGLT